MPSGLTVSIPVKIYIREYFENLYGSPVVFPRKHHLNAAIASRLQKAPENLKPKPSDPSDLQIELLYNETVNVLYRNHLSEIAKEKIRSELRNIFYAQFHKFVNERFAKGMQVKESVWEFINHYQLSPDAYETLAKKMVRRLSDDRSITPQKPVRCASHLSVTPSMRRKNNQNNNVRCARQMSVQLSIF